MNKGKTLIEWSVVCAIAFLCVMCSPLGKVIAQEFQVDKNVAFNFTAPIRNLTNDSALPTGLNNTAFLVDINNTNTWTTAATNITGTNPYLFQLNATETNGSGDKFSVMYNASGCWQFLKFNTAVKEAVDTNTGYGSAINATVNHATYGNSALNTKLGGLTNVTLAATQTGVTIPTVTAVTNAVVLPTGTGAGQISLSSGAVTVGTNNDKTGYTASTVSDKTGYALSGTQAFNVTGNVLGNVTSVTNPVVASSVTGNVGGNITGNVEGTANLNATLAY